MPEEPRGSDFTILGQVTREAVKKLEVFDAPKSVCRVVLQSDEFTSLCPVTGAPDYCTVTIVYDPDKVCIESKSLKLYLWTFREEGHFCEALSDLILGDVVAATRPKQAEVTVEQKPRGGVSIASVAKYSGELDDVHINYDYPVIKAEESYEDEADKYGR